MYFSNILMTICAYTAYLIPIYVKLVSMVWSYGLRSYQAAVKDHLQEALETDKQIKQQARSPCSMFISEMYLGKVVSLMP